MHTLECFEFTLGRLSQLRERLTQPDVRYFHGKWATDCGSPSCALGHATVEWPDEIQLLKSLTGVLRPEHLQSGESHEHAGRKLFKFPCSAFAEYLFLWCHYVISCGRYEERLRDDGGKLPETLRRFDKLIAYYQRRVDTLHREQRERLELRRSRRATRKRAVEVAV